MKTKEEYLNKLKEIREFEVKEIEKSKYIILTKLRELDNTIDGLTISYGVSSHDGETMHHIDFVIVGSLYRSNKKFIDLEDDLYEYIDALYKFQDGFVTYGDSLNEIKNNLYKK